MIEYRNSLVEETEDLKKILWKYGPNEWNYLTKEGVEEELALIEQGEAQAVVATMNGEIVGFSILISGSRSPTYIQKYGSKNEMGFIADVVVSSSYSGKGIATNLLVMSIDSAKSLGFSKVLIERHEENLASAGMMKKAGFYIIDTFYDPKKRSSGSKNSVILEFKI